MRRTSGTGRTWWRAAIVTALAGAASVVGLGGGSASAAPVHYVATTGADAGTCTQAAPCLTIGFALGIADPGDTIEVAAGDYPEQVVIGKAITLRGAGPTATVLRGTVATPNVVFTSCPNPAMFGITINASNVTIENLGVRDFGCAGIVGGPAPLSDITIDTVDASNNGFEGNIGRGVLFANSDNTPALDYQRIAIVDSTFVGNRLVGIDVNVGRADNVTISGNTVRDNGDAGITLAGGSNSSVTSNTVVNNGRYGIEIRNPTGPITVGANTVTASNDDTQAAPDRWPAGASSTTLDYAGIAVYLRGVAQPGGNAEGNAVVPAGVVVVGNVVSGYLRDATGSGTGQGFGIVLEGTGHTVANNTVFRNDVGVQLQSGNTANTPSTPGFDRGNTAAAVAVQSFTANVICGNRLAGARLVGTAAAGTISADGNWWGVAAGPTVGDTRAIAWAATGTIGPDNVPAGVTDAAPAAAGVGSLPAGLSCADPNAPTTTTSTSTTTTTSTPTTSTTVAPDNTLNEVTTQPATTSATTTIPGGRLPATGRDSSPGLVLGVLAVALGAVLVVVARRRTAA